MFWTTVQRVKLEGHKFGKFGELMPVRQILAPQKILFIASCMGENSHVHVSTRLMLGYEYLQLLLEERHTASYWQNRQNYIRQKTTFNLFAKIFPLQIYPLYGIVVVTMKALVLRRFCFDLQQMYNRRIKLN